MLKIKFYDSIVPRVTDFPTIGNKRLKFDSSIEWYYGSSHCDIAMYTDYNLTDIYSNRKHHKLNIALLIESPAISGVSERIIEIENEFDYIFTFNNELLKRGERYKLYFLGGCWIDKPDIRLHRKTKSVSMVASNKKGTDGHKLRHVVKDRYSDIIDIYGSINKPIKYKFDGLKDYAYSIAMENCQHDIYFSEKIIDCFMTGTVPIYWGSNDITSVFNQEGMFIFNNMNELEEIIKGLHEAKVSHEVIEENFETAKDMSVTENNIMRTLEDVLE